MRRAAKKDDNHSTIVNELRAIGLSVADTSQLGKGFPDIVVGVRGKNYMFEIKDGDKTPSRRKLTPDEIEFKKMWDGQYDVILSTEDALTVIGFVNDIQSM